MTLVVALGSLAAIASTVSFAPQAVKIIRTRRTKDISAGMYTLSVTAFALWCAYGVLLGQWPLIAANGICLFLSGFILVMKLLPRRDKEKVADAVTPKG
jgi:MtN3 and saliva related transmembrane protein